MLSSPTISTLDTRHFAKPEPCRPWQLVRLIERSEISLTKLLGRLRSPGHSETSSSSSSASAEMTVIFAI